MKHRFPLLRRLASPVVLAVACAALHAEEEAASYILSKPGLPAAGAEIKGVTSISFPEMVMHQQNEEGKDEEAGKVSLNNHMEETLTVQEGGKAVCVLTKTETKVKGVMGGEPQEDDDSTSDRLDKKVTAELKDGHCVLTMDDEDGKAQELDEGEANDMIFSPVHFLFRSKALYGEAPRKPGDKWDVDLSKLDGFGFASAKPEGKLSAEFVKVVEIDGEKCAEIHFDFELSGASSDTTVKSKGQETIHRRLSDLVDVDTKITEKVEMLHAEEGEAAVQSARGEANIEQTCTTKKP